MKLNAVPLPLVMADPLAMTLVLTIVLGLTMVYVVLSCLVEAGHVLCFVVMGVILSAVLCKCSLVYKCIPAC